MMPGSTMDILTKIGRPALLQADDTPSLAVPILLDGTLRFSLSEAMAPAVGTVFPLITSDDSISGTFDDFVYGGPAIGTAKQWFIRYEPNAVSLLMTFPGDYNGDVSVDAADYVVWRKTDGTQPGYDKWRANFGRTAGLGATAGSSSSASVPEPAAIHMVLIASLTAFHRRRPGFGAV
jgi:hypothetical protein